MENLTVANTKFLLERSLEDLYHTSKEWLSEIDFWKTELAFFQKILDVSASKLKSKDEKKEMDHLQNLIIFYNGELLDKYRQEVKRHMKYLAELVQNKPDMDDETYREDHVKYYDQITSFAKRFKEFKKELFDFFYAYT